MYEGTQDLKQQILAGEPTEEEVRPDIEEKLDEILALLSRYRATGRSQGWPNGPHFSRKYSMILLA